MKWSTRILVAILVILFGGLIASIINFKMVYDQIDKSDMYWNYDKVLDQHFTHLKIEGGNVTNIVFEQRPNCSVRVLSDWQRFHEKLINTWIKNDTLFVKFIYSAKNMGEINWMKYTNFVRIFCPHLVSVDGFNTKLLLSKVQEKSLRVTMAGKSTFEAESMITHLDSLTLSLQDSSQMEFEMSPEYRVEPKRTAEQDGRRIEGIGGIKVQINPLLTAPIKSQEAMYIGSVNASLTGYTLLDIGHAQVQTLKLQVADSSAVILSGGALKKVKG